MYKIIDLFCGAGGLSLGFTDHRFCGGFEPILAIDNNNSAIETYKENFGTSHGFAADIESWLNENEVPRADIVIGGPPCQGFSLLNKNRDGDNRRTLWAPYLDIVEKSGAKIFLMENVPEILRSEEFNKIKNYAHSLGFQLHNPSVLIASDYGVPQVRRRAIIIGIQKSIINNIPHFPPPKTHSKEGSKTLWKTVSDAIKDLPEPVGTDIRSDEKPPLNLHFGRNPTEISKERYRAVPPGGNRFDLQKNRPDITPNCWLKKKSGGTDLFGRLWWDRPSITIRTEFFKPEKGRYLHPEQHRPITHREAARIMSFPDDFKFIGNKIEIAKQIGNAVPPVFAGALARYVKQILDTRP
jgi:DNA (cytosine-5)-methyltransferase 1